MIAAMFRDRSNAALRPTEPTDAACPAAPVARIAPIEMRRVEQEAPRETPAAAPAADATTKAPKRSLKKTALMGALVAALALGGWYGQYWWVTGRFLVSTDDAYVGVHTATLAAKVPGYVAAVKAEDNAKVHAGDVVAMLDDGDYRIAVDAAHANIATQAATIERIGKQIIAQQAAVAQAKAQLTSANAAATRTDLEPQRQQALANQAFASKQKLEQAQSDRDQALAAVQGAVAGIDAADTNVAVLKAQQQEAARTLDQLKTTLAKAERDLSFTTIRAPFEGIIGNRAMQSGDYVQLGQRLASLVPLDDVYIDANFKETQLADLHPGQPVSIAVDALDGHAIAGTVESVAPASGSVFSLLPPDNATGNFTKVVQRIPVRIRVPAKVGAEEVLRPGMSVVVSVDTKPGAENAAATTAIVSK
jgi:membrane fusion protein, multidrug efflux system